MATRETGVRTADVVARCVVLPNFEREGWECVGGGASSFPRKHEWRGGGEECGSWHVVLPSTREEAAEAYEPDVCGGVLRSKRETPICADECDVGREEDDDEPDEMHAKAPAKREM